MEYGDWHHNSAERCREIADALATLPTEDNITTEDFEVFRAGAHGGSTLWDKSMLQDNYRMHLDFLTTRYSGAAAAANLETVTRLC